MKICFFTENYYKGGLDTFLINLINAWPVDSDELTLVCNASHAGLDTIHKKTRRAINIVKYWRFFTSAILKGQTHYSYPIQILARLAYRFFQYPILLPWYIFTLMLFFRRNEFDRLLVVNGGYPASLLCRSAVIAWRLGVKHQPAIMNFHGSALSPSRFFEIFENLIDKMVANSASHIVSVSKDCLSSLSARTSFLGCSKLSYIYNGIEDPIRLVKTELNFANSSDEKYCLMLATYQIRKGHSYLLRAFQTVIKDYPHFQLHIYGYGLPHEKQRVADEVVKLQLENNVKLWSFTSQTIGLLARASLLVVPSQAPESFGLTIIEAMSFGVPVVVTDVGGLPEVLGDSGAGYVCSKDDPLEFANAIKKILADPVLASEMGKNGRIAFEKKYTASRMAKSYRRLLE